MTRERTRTSRRSGQSSESEGATHFTRFCAGATAGALLFSALVLLAPAGCSDDAGNPGRQDASGDGTITGDGALGGDGITVKDSSSQSDAKLWACTNPGQPCNAHDTCAIDPVCSNDGLCVPTSWQRCDDGLPCTKDICGKLGTCTHEPIPGTCALPVKRQHGTEIRCFKAKDTSPDDGCMECNPDADKGKGSLKWSPRNGGFCDDGDACTKDDYCQGGVCRGADFRAKCADAYGCTDEICDGKGGCLGNKLKSDWCLINGRCIKDGENNTDGSCTTCNVKKTQSGWSTFEASCQIGNQCFKAGDKHVEGCSRCEPAVSSTKWTVTGTTQCLIQNGCMKAGTLDVSGCGVCDPTRNKYDYSPKPDLCKVAGQCYQPGAKDPTGCAECNPSKNPTGFTPLSTKCLVLGTCFDAGAKDATGCRECAPQTSSTDFSMIAGKCMIRGNCVPAGGASKSGCGTCEAGKSIEAFTDKTGAKLQMTDFESGLGGYVVSAAIENVGWQISTKRKHSGTASLYYGNPTTGTYAGSSPSQGTAKSPAISLPAGQHAALFFWLYLDAEPSNKFDVLTVRVNDQDVWKKDPATDMPLGDFREWIPVEVDLSAYAGTAVTITFEFNTMDAWDNAYEGPYIDDVAILTECGAL